MPSTQRDLLISTTSMTHYIRIEGVNLFAFAFDTRNLSTTRGGSLLLLDAIPAVQGELERVLTKDCVRVISQGASSGLFAVHLGEHEIWHVLDCVRKRLGKDSNWMHATFVVDAIELDATGADGEGAFRKDLEGLLAANRWRQMQAAALAVPKRAGEATGWGKQPVCDLDGLRPVMHGSSGEDRNRVLGKRVSLASWQRWQYGRNGKQNFYRNLTGFDESSFANDFSEICTGVSSLDGKLAVFYADGNGFGSIQAKHCRDEDSQRRWDCEIRRQREEFLIHFLEAAQNDERWLVPAEAGEREKRPTMRFETLLWGGDELMFVMPAALGWQFAAMFFDRMSGASFGTQTLTHAAGLVFCQHHTPIHRLQGLVRDQMVEFSKGIDRERDSLMVVALESLDHLGTSYEESMNGRYRGVQPLKKNILAAPEGCEMGKYLLEIATSVEALRGSESFARSQLRTLVARVLEQADRAGAEQEAAIVEGALPECFSNASPEDVTVLRGSLYNLFGRDSITLWLQLEELWDYARN